VQRDLPGKKTRRITIGPVNLLTLEAAKQQAAELLLQMHQGIDPKAKRKAAQAAKEAEERASVTLRAAFAEFLAARPKLRQKSKADYIVSMRFFDNWMDRPMREITREMVQARHRQIAADVAERSAGKRNGASSANGAMRTLRALWNYAADDGGYDLLANPVKLRKQWFHEPRRESYIKPQDLAKFYAAVEALPNAVARDFLVMALFTGMRRGELSSLRWEDVDLEHRTLRVRAARTKGGKTLALPLCDVVYDLLRARRALGDTGFVFPSTGKTGHLAEPKFPLALVGKACGIAATCHDLRRTFVTVAEACGVDQYALKALVGHSFGDVTGGYVQMTPERLREPLQKVTDRLKALCGLEVKIVQKALAAV
jgi:integrase